MREEKRHPNHPGELGTDESFAEKLRDPSELEARARAIDVLNDAGIPFVVGGAYAFANYTGIFRDTKDLDLFPMKKDAGRALEVLERDGWETEKRDEGWLYKAYKGEYFVDFIFSSGNGIAVVDELWFEHASKGTAFGRDVLLAPPEEMIWSKGFVQERERFDGADVSHLIRARGDRMDWHRLLARFDRYWEVLFGHIQLFRFTYPSDRTKVPDWVMTELMQRTLSSVREGNWTEKVCRGPLLSRLNYDIDIRDWGYLNGRKWDETDREKEGGRLATGSELEDSNRGGR